MKIAVFATGWNGEYLRDMYHGLENSQKEFHDSIHLYASFGRLGSGDSFNKSEFDFFELADMEAYDGFLYPSTTVKEGDVKQRLLERIIESKKPCVSLEEEIPGLSFVGINQSKAMRQIVRHLAGVHGIRTFGFINGMKDTYEAQMRQQGIESKIRELGLCLMPEWVDYGNYEYRSGETYARKMIAAYEAGEELPQAVISANDLMAGLEQARQQKAVDDYLRLINRADLIIVDEFGYPLMENHPSYAALFYAFISSRYEKKEHHHHNQPLSH